MFIIYLIYSYLLCLYLFTVGVIIVITANALCYMLLQYYNTTGIWRFVIHGFAPNSIAASLDLCLLTKHILVAW